MRFVVRVPLCRDWRVRLIGMLALHCPWRGDEYFGAQKGRDVSLIPTLTDPLFLRDPYPTYGRLHARGVSGWDEDRQMWLIWGYAETHEALRSPRLSVHTAGARLGQAGPRYAPVVEAVSRFLTRLDGPAHRRIRGLLLRAFTPRAVEQMEDTIRACVLDLLRPHLNAGSMDIVADLAIPLPLTVIGTMLGVPRADHVQVKAWASALGGIADLDPNPKGLERALRALEAFRDYVGRLIAEHRRQPGDDLLGALVTVEEAGDRLSPDELVAICQVLLIAGHETTTGLLGNAVQLLLAHPEVLEAVRQTPRLLPGFIEEVLRYDSPVQVRTRLATQELPLGGQRVAAGQALLLLVGAANRDPRVFKDPDQFDLQRTPNHHLAFGEGPHYCLGAALARLEGRMAVEILLEELPRLALAPGSQVRRQPNFSLRSWESLPIVFA
jgi:cytochrome P450